MEAIWIAVAVGLILLISGLGYVFGSGAIVIFGVLAKSAIAYTWKFLAPIWILLKSRNPYKIGAIALTFSSFLLHFYSFLQLGDTSVLTSATNALSATITGSLQEIVASGTTLISDVVLQEKLLAVALLFMAAGKIYLYFVGWKMLKNRVPELTYYLLVVFTFYLLTWGSQDANALFEVFDFASTAADQAGNQFANSSMPLERSNISSG